MFSLMLQTAESRLSKMQNYRSRRIGPPQKARRWNVKKTIQLLIFDYAVMNLALRHVHDCRCGGFASGKSRLSDGCRFFVATKLLHVAHCPQMSTPGDNRQPGRQAVSLFRSSAHRLNRDFKSCKSLSCRLCRANFAVAVSAFDTSISEAFWTAPMPHSML